MAKKTAKGLVAKEVKSAKYWTKQYIESIHICLEEERFKEALYYAQLLGPLWGQIEVELEEFLEGQE